MPDTVGIAGITDRPLVPLAGVVWRSCHFEAGEAPRIDWTGVEGAVRIVLPPDLAGAVPQRRSEFMAGRLCAALALRAAGAEEVVGRVGRAPVWPAGIRGSISHGGGRAMAVVTRAHVAIGLDCEAVLSPRQAAEIAPMVVSRQDRAHRPDDWSEAAFCSVIFSAKEAAYKAVSDRLDGIPDFDEALVLGIAPPVLTLALRGHVVAVRITLTRAVVVSLASIAAAEC